MDEWLVLLVTLPFVAALLLSGLWAGRRFSHHRELPGHFDFAGRPTRMAPRGVMVWLLPATFSFSLLAMAAMIALVPVDQRKGEVAEVVPLIVLIALILLGAQALVLWLMIRWERTL